MSLLNEALLVGASQGLLLCIVILSLPSANVVANRLLVLYVGLESLHLFFLYLSYLDATSAPPPLLRFLCSIRVLDGPAVYLYVRSLTTANFRLELGQLRHLWVFGVLLAWFIPLSSDPVWAGLSTRELQELPSTVAISAYQSLALVGYALVAWRLLNSHQRRLQQALSEVDSVNLAWLQWLMVALIAVNVLHLSLDTLRLFDVIGADSKVVINLTMTLLLIYLISIGGLRQPQVFTQPVREALAAIGGDGAGLDVSGLERHGGDSSDAQAAAGAETEAERGKYQKSGLDELRRREIWAELQTLMARDKPFLDATLDLPKLARQLMVRPQELSEVINTLYGGSFYDLVNRSRVEAAKALLQEPAERRRKMLDIALSVGFSSQSTFYNQFKKQTGMTPTSYREEGKA